jgi:tRNA(adenine34) deaminase
MNDRDYMKIALHEAEKAARRGEVPVGAVLVDAEGNIVGQDGNRSIEYNDPTGHAEIVVLRQAGEKCKNYRLTGSTFYVTIEPCAMCAGALVHARVSRVVFGAEDPKAGAMVSCYRIGSDRKLNHTIEVTGGILEEESSELLRSFFRERRVK